MTREHSRRATSGRAIMDAATMTSTTDSESTIHHSSQAQDPDTSARWSLCVVHHADPSRLGRGVLLPPSGSLELGRKYDGFGPEALRDGRVSRAHATLTVHRDGAVELRDSGSHNGTYVNGARVEGAALLARGDVLRLGSILLLVGYDAELPRMLDHASLVGMSPALGTIAERLAHVSRTNAPTTIWGETGTGKALIAAAIHEASGRGGPLVRVPCAAIPDRLVATELFGHERGAFPGADEPHDGYIPRAEGGTVVFEGLEDATPRLQGALLGFLDDRVAHRLGCSDPLRVDARIVVTMSADPDTSTLRVELATRLTQQVIAAVPLRERVEDIAVLAAHFARLRAGTSVVFHWRTALKLLRYSWPGNVRQLQQIVERIVDQGSGVEPLKLSEDVERLLGPRHAAVATEQQVAAGEDEPGVVLPPRRLSKRKLQELLREHEGNVTAIAAQLGVGRNTLYRWLKVAGLDQADFRHD